MKRIVAIASLAFGMISCSPPTPQKLVNEAAKSPDDSAAVARPATGTPMDKSAREVRDDLWRLLSCERIEDAYVCYPDPGTPTYIVVHDDDVGHAESVTAMLVTKVAHDQGARPMPKSRVGYALLRYIFPQWTGSKAWLDHRYEIARKKDSWQYCDGRVGWHGVYATAEMISRSDGNTYINLEISLDRERATDNQRDLCSGPIDLDSKSSDLPWLKGAESTS